MSGKPSSKCACGRPGCKGCSKPTESKARQVVATLIGEAGFDPRDMGPEEHEELESPGHESGEHEGGEHDETDMSIPEERTEVSIASEILSALDSEDEDVESRLEHVRALAQEILDLHDQGEEGEEGVDGEEGPLPGDGEPENLEDFESELGLKQ